MSVATHHSGPEGRTHLRELVGSGDRIALFVLPFFVVGLVLNQSPRSQGLGSEALPSSRLASSPRWWASS